MSQLVRSYTSVRQSWLSRVRELIALYQHKRTEGVAQVRFALQRFRDVERLIEERTGVRIENKKCLDIGPGQKLRQMVYFHSRGNDVVGIDLNEVVQGFNLGGYWRMYRQNGALRVAKTLARKALLLDRAYERAMVGELGLAAFPRLPVLQMDASKTTFPGASFDFIFSYSVFEHLPDPVAVMTEVKRILKPGGVAYLSLHLYTSETGCHDARLFREDRGGLPPWPHLRPQHAAKVSSNAYLNGWRIEQWRKEFAAALPGVQFEAHQYGKNKMAPVLNELRAAGELADYGDEELLTVDFAAIWKKPG